MLSGEVKVLDDNHIHKGRGELLNPRFSAVDEVTNRSQVDGCVLCGTLVNTKEEAEIGG